MSTVRRIAASTATALLLCASSSHATREHPFDESVVTCDGGCVFEFGDDGSVSLSAVGDWIEVTGDITIDGDFSISATTVIISAVISSTDSLIINAAESLEFDSGNTIDSRSSPSIGIRSPSTIGLEGSLVTVGATLRALGGTGGALFLSEPRALNEGVVFAASEIAAAPLLETESLDAGGSTLLLNIIPEPTTIVLLGAGVAFFGIARRR